MVLEQITEEKATSMIIRSCVNATLDIQILPDKYQVLFLLRNFFSELEIECQCPDLWRSSHSSRAGDIFDRTVTVYFWAEGVYF